MRITFCILCLLSNILNPLANAGKWSWLWGDTENQDCAKKINKPKPLKYMKIDDLEKSFSKAIEILKNKELTTMLVDLSAMENWETFEKIFESRLDAAGFKTIDIETSATGNPNDRWNQIRDRLNRKFGTHSNQWKDDGADAISGTAFFRNLLLKGEIHKERPTVLFFKNYAVDSIKPDPITAWLETLDDGLSAYDYKNHGAILVVISSRLSTIELGSKEQFKRAVRFNPFGT